MFADSLEYLQLVVDEDARRPYVGAEVACPQFDVDIGGYCGRDAGVGHHDQRYVHSVVVERATFPAVLFQQLHRRLQLLEFLVDEGLLEF
jgi:hypothetical protein